MRMGEFLRVLRRSPSAFFRAWPVVIALAVCGLACVNIWLGPGILNTRAGGDSPFLLQRVFELAVNLRAGEFPARWMPDAAYGLGYPFFHFYAALPYYLAAGLNLIGFDLLAAIKLTQTLGMLAAAGAMGLYARTRLPTAGAVLAVVAYTLAPFHLVNVYVRGDSLSEFYAFVWYPLILWAVDRVARRRASVADVLVLAASLAALVLTHNVSALIFAPFIALYALAALWRERRSAPVAGSVARLGLAAGLAIALAAWFWLPALGDARLVQLGDQTTGYFNYANHFRSVDLVQPGGVFDYSVSSDSTPFAVGLVQAALAVLGGAVCVARVIRSRRALDGPVNWTPVVWVALLALATFMVTPLSQIVWEKAPLLALAQFPWRFLSILALFAALLTGGLAFGDVERETSNAKRQTSNVKREAPIVNRQSSIPNPKSQIQNRPWLVLAPILLLVVQSIPGLPNERLNIRAEDVTPDTLKLYEWFTGNIGTTIRAEYLPVSTQPRPLIGPDVVGMPRRAVPVQGVIGASTLEEMGPARQVWQVDVDSQAATFTLPLLYWPAWRARVVGGRDLELKPYIGSGWVQMSLPRGQHRIELWLDATPLQRAGEAVSLAALLVAGVVAGAAWLRRRAGERGSRGAGERRSGGATSAQPQMRAGYVIGGVGVGVVALILLALVIRWLDSPVSPPLKTLDFAGRPFPHRGPVTFVDGDGHPYTLTRAIVSPLAVNGGDPFTLTTEWAGGRAPAQVGVQQVLPQGGYFAFLFRFAREASLGAPALSTHRALSGALPGPMPLTVLAQDASGQPLTPTVASGEHQGQAMLAGLTILASQPLSTEQVIRTFPNGIVLQQLDWIYTSEHSICIRPTWSTTRPRADALKVSLRLRGSDGREVAVADGEPQGGLAPTWAWPVGAAIGDNYCVDLIDTLDFGESYTLLLRWYRLLDNRTEGEVTLVGARGQGLRDVHLPHLAITDHRDQPPAMQVSSRALFANTIRLLGYDLVTGTSSLSLTLHWQGLVPISEDYKFFVHLAPMDRGEPVRQADRLTLDGLYPTGVWLPGEVVSDSITLDLTGVSPGRYRLAIGWYDPNTLARLPATDGGRPVPDGWLVLAEVVR